MWIADFRSTTRTAIGPIRKDDVTKKPRSHIKAAWLLLVLTALLGRALAIQSDEIPPVFRVPIEGTIDHGLAPFVARVVEEASEIEGSVVLLDIDTFGGRVDAAVLIRDVLLESPVRTVAFIHPRAISAGALISLACENIVIAPGGSIGAATPIYAGGGAEEEPRQCVVKWVGIGRAEKVGVADDEFVEAVKGRAVVASGRGGDR